MDAFDKVVDYLIQCAKYNWVYYTSCMMEELDENPEAVREIGFSEEDMSLFQLLSRKMKEENVERYVLKAGVHREDKAVFAKMCGEEDVDAFVANQKHGAEYRMATEMLGEALARGEKGILELVQFMKYVVLEAKLYDSFLKTQPHLN